MAGGVSLAAPCTSAPGQQGGAGAVLVQPRLGGPTARFLHARARASVPAPPRCGLPCVVPAWAGEASSQPGGAGTRVPKGGSMGGVAPHSLITRPAWTYGTGPRPLFSTGGCPYFVRRTQPDVGYTPPHGVPYPGEKGHRGLVHMCTRAAGGGGLGPSPPPRGGSSWLCTCFPTLGHPALAGGMQPALPEVTGWVYRPLVGFASRARDLCGYNGGAA